MIIGINIVLSRFDLDIFSQHRENCCFQPQKWWYHGDTLGTWVKTSGPHRDVTPAWIHLRSISIVLKLRSICSLHVHLSHCTWSFLYIYYIWESLPNDPIWPRCVNNDHSTTITHSSTSKRRTWTWDPASMAGSNFPNVFMWIAAFLGRLSPLFQWCHVYLGFNRCRDLGGWFPSFYCFSDNCYQGNHAFHFRTWNLGSEWIWNHLILWVHLFFVTPKYPTSS